MAGSLSKGADMPAACWSRRLGPPPGRLAPLRAFFLRIRAKRGVATARKLAVLIWHLIHKKETYAWARPALQARKNVRSDLNSYTYLFARSC
jgi:hypothetical protein